MNNSDLFNEYRNVIEDCSNSDDWTDQYTDAYTGDQYTYIDFYEDEANGNVDRSY